MIQLSPDRWAAALIVAVFVGLSKTGVPGVGILTVPLIAYVFEGRLSVGMLLPLLIAADCFAVAYYRKHANWSRLKELIVPVLIGMAVAALFLDFQGSHPNSKSLMNILIGVMTLLILGAHLLKAKLGSQFSLSSKGAIWGTGIAGGFTTTASNAAGPIMSIYMTSLGLGKEGFMGTTACYYFLFNLLKFPLFLFLTYLHPESPMLPMAALPFTLLMFPFVALGALTGRKLLAKLDQKTFENLVLVLAAIAAIAMIVRH